jgi:hypothetical protein
LSGASIRNRITWQHPSCGHQRSHNLAAVGLPPVALPLPFHCVGPSQNRPVPSCGGLPRSRRSRIASCGDSRFVPKRHSVVWVGRDRRLSVVWGYGGNAQVGERVVWVCRAWAAREPHTMGAALRASYGDPHDGNRPAEKPQVDEPGEKCAPHIGVIISFAAPHDAPVPGCATFAASEVAEGGRSGIRGRTTWQARASEVAQPGSTHRASIRGRATWQNGHQKSHYLAGSGIRTRATWQRARRSSRVGIRSRATWRPWVPRTNAWSVRARSRWRREASPVARVRAHLWSKLGFLDSRKYHA